MTKGVGIPIAGKLLATPTFFPSISSIKTNFAPIAYLELLISLRAPQLLISAFDVKQSADQAAVIEEIDCALRCNTILLLDSGGYEAHWMKDREWRQEYFHEVLGRHDWPLAFSFDVKADTPLKEAEQVKKITDSYIKDQLRKPTCVVIPIVHGKQNDLPRLCAAVAINANPIAVAVPERELGDGIYTRIKTVKQIREH